MDIGDEKVEGSSSSLLIDSLESNWSGNALSPEDIAWADSCLVATGVPDISEADWSSLKDVLLEILSLQPESNESSVTVSDDYHGQTDIEILPSSEAGTVQSSGGTNDDILINEETETSSDGFLNEEETDIPSSQLVERDLVKTCLKHAFLPHYKDDVQRVGEPVDLGLDILAHEMEPSTDDIFRVWDLGIPDEEDELVKQLNNALSESSLQSMPSTSDDSGAWKDLKVESLDNLVTGVADLSLNQYSS